MDVRWAERFLAAAGRQVGGLGSRFLDQMLCSRILATIQLPGEAESGSAGTQPDKEYSGRRVCRWRIKPLAAPSSGVIFLPCTIGHPSQCLQKSLGAAEPILNDDHPLNLTFSLAALSLTSSAEFALQKIAGWRLRSWAWFRGPTSGARFRYPPSIRANRRSGQTPLYLMRRRTRVRSQPGWPEQTHLIHGSLAGTPGGMFGRSFQP